MSTIKVDKIEKRTGSTLTLGGPGTAVTLACGSTQTGFGRTGTVDWCTTAKTSPFTSVSGNGYFINTSGGAVTVTLPASPSAGDIVAIKDYAGTWGDACKAVTIGRNSSKLDATCTDSTRDTANESLTLIYVDGTQGWKSVEEGTGFIGENFICASGGNAVVTCGNFKTHIFTGSGTFTVNSIATTAPNNIVDYLVVAGAGGSGTAGSAGGGGGAGGFRMANSLSLPAPTTSPLANPTGVPVSAQAYPITIGAGGAGATTPQPNNGANGNPSIFSTITSTAGGFGGGYDDSEGDPGGSGGGGGDPNGPQPNSGGAGNTPPVSPPQGNTGGEGTGPGGSDGTQASGGGGGAGAVGAAGTFSPHTGGAGGIGSFIADAFVGPTAPSYGTPGPVSSTRYFAGGGGGNSQNGKGAGGSGGGGTSVDNGGVAGTVNTGGGASGGRCSNGGEAGGSGIIMIRYKFQ